jgi:hypothetical protein
MISRRPSGHAPVAVSCPGSGRVSLGHRGPLAHGRGHGGHRRSRCSYRQSALGLFHLLPASLGHLDPSQAPRRDLVDPALCLVDLSL